VTPTRNRLSKIATIIQAVPRRREIFKRGASRLYDDILLAESPIPSVSARDFLGENIAITLDNFLPVDGNVSLDELAFLCALARQLAPRRIVEIGTFDGNTALQFALNTPPESRIFTLDLPVGAEMLAESDFYDASYIASERRVRRRFLGTSVEHKVTQCYGNSLTFDFSAFVAGGNPELIFIDAGHSYDCVRNDSQKALSILAPGGTIVWQDYSTGWPDVYRYLAELSATQRLVRIEATSLIVYKAPA
jgi:predicted O-methyltransferase YrrM